MSDATPSEISLISPRACLLFLFFVSKEQKIGHQFKNVLERQKAGQLDHLAEFGEIIQTFLDFLQAVTNGVTLESNLEKGVAHRAFEEKVVGHCERVLGRQ